MPLPSSLTVDSGATLREALRRLEDTGSGVLLIVDDEGRLVRTVTNGDVRRLLLAGASLEATLELLPPAKPKVAPVGVSSIEALKFLNQFAIDHLPIVDESGHPVSILSRHDIDSPILLSSPHMSDFELGYVAEAFRSNWIAPLGPNVDAFEKELADHVGIGHAAALVSGTAAIHLALRLLGIGPGDTVFSSSFTFVASANPILYQGAQPVFIDSEPETWNMSPKALRAAFADAERSGHMPKAVIVVDLYGQSADIDAIAGLCDRYDVPIVEDAAESLGASYKGRASGTLGKIGIYSFNGNKIITTSGGGMLVSDDEALVSKARFLSTQARDPAPYYEHSELGYNYRMSNVLAGIGRGQLRVLDDRVSARRAVFERYAEGLAHVPAIRWMPEAGFGRSTRWLTACVLDPEQGAPSPDELIRALAAERIELRRLWKPMHLQPLFAPCDYFAHDEEHSVSDDLFKHGVCLPSGSNLTRGQQQRIIEAMLRALSGSRQADAQPEPTAALVRSST